MLRSTGRPSTVVVEASSATVFSRLCIKVCLLLCPYYSFRSELDSKSGIATSPFKRSHLVPVPRMLIQLPHSLETNPQRTRCSKV